MTINLIMMMVQSVLVFRRTEFEAVESSIDQSVWPDTEQFNQNLKMAFQPEFEQILAENSSLKKTLEPKLGPLSADIGKTIPRPLVAGTKYNCFECLHKVFDSMQLDRQHSSVYSTLGYC